MDLNRNLCQYIGREALDASFYGQVVVGTISGGAGIWTPDSVTLVPVAFTSPSSAFAVSDDGQTIALGVNDDGTYLWRVGISVTQIIPLGGSARGLSADGTVVVGNEVQVLQSAIRWTDQCGIEPLGTEYDARATSANGLVIAGSNPFGESWIWDPVNGVRNLKAYLRDDLGLSDVNGWDLELPNDFSNDGTVLVGSGLNPSNQQEGWVAYIPEVVITRGDFTDDGVVDLADVAGFCAVLVAPCDATIRDRYAADMNDDRIVDAVDVGLFTQELLGP
ncbi:MAG: hypothetical protein H6818_24200 [Phycisphaerales bacterium]|nr:hypothetical protein [Phycisphaerales bacterium]